MFLFTVSLKTYKPSAVGRHDVTKSGVELRNRKKRAGELLGIISDLGPAIIKAGQALSSRPDLLPKEYLDELQKLQVW